MRRSLAIPAFTMAVLAAAAGHAPADYSVTDLVGAAKRGDGHAVHRLLADRPDSVREVDGAGYTALHWAAIRGHWRIFCELLEAGAPVNAVGSDGGTPLHWASHHDRPDMVALLLDAGADPGIHNRWGRTPLHVAARRGCAGVADLLLARGADPDATTLEGWTPLHVAARSGQAAVTELLLAHGADPERLDDEGLTPAQARRPRPPAIGLDPARLDDYTGIYDLGGGATVKVWREDDHLGIREFAPDELVAVGPDTFACRQEPWLVRFGRDHRGEVASVELQFLRRTVSGTKTSAPRFVGSAVCMSCHSGAEAGRQDVLWLRSRHAHAYWRLAADWALFLGRLRPQYHDLEHPVSDPRCLLCHVTGAQDPDALFAATFRPEEGVSCEACHGPGSLYTDPEIMSDRTRFLAHGGVVPDQATCSRCHRASERFDFATWWPRIAHPRRGSTVYVFRRAGSSWSEVQKLELHPKPQLSYFYSPIVISGDLAVAGRDRIRPAPASTSSCARTAPGRWTPRFVPATASRRSGRRWRYPAGWSRWARPRISPAGPLPARSTSTNGPAASGRSRAGSTRPRVPRIASVPRCRSPRRRCSSGRSPT